MKRTPMIRLALTAAILSALTPIAFAADAASDPQATPSASPAPAAKSAAEAAKTDTQSLEGIVVTGAAANGGIRKIDASYNIVAASAEEIKQANPKSTADLLKISPGLWPESTGGQTGANIEIAGFPGGGDALYFTALLNGSPLYGMPTLSFQETSSMFRLDDTVERVEIVQGGPGSVFAGGQIGATANFILKTGTAEPSGDVGLTYGSEGLWRLDGWYGFKLADGWYASVGGFWRTSDGVRDPQFKADDGGQLTATLTHDLDNGSFTLYARRLDDKNQFVTPIPVYQTGVGQFTSYPGFDPLTDTYYSKAMQHVYLESYPGGGTNANLADGRGSKLNYFGGNFDYELPGGWSLSDKFLYDAGDMDTNALFSGNNPESLNDFLAGEGIPSTAVTSASLTTGGAVSGDSSVISQGWWHIHKHIKNLNNDFRLSKEIFEGNTLTAGLYLAHYTDDDKWSLGNQMLMTNTPNATPIKVSYTNAGSTYYVTDNQGFHDLSGNYDITESGSANNKAFYISDSWRIDRWLFDASGRVENQSAHLLVCNRTAVDLDGNPNTLYDNNVPACNGTFARTDYNKTHPAWTLGVNYELADNMAVYGRATKGPHFGDFDNDLRGNTTGNTPPMQKYQGFEVGYKYQSSLLYADINAYHKQFSGLVYTPVDINGNPIGGPSIYGSDSKGVNMNIVVTPIENLKLTFLGNYLDGHYTHHDGCTTVTNVDGTVSCINEDGVQLQRQPKVHWAFTPSYTLPTGWGSITGYVRYTYVGQHTEDTSGLQYLGTYKSYDAGVIANWGTHWQFSLFGTNLTNALGFTEGNARISGTEVGINGVILARAFEGREVNVQAKYKF